ncbi:hypothetical protein DMUE_1047 [Dictyocoela muelleri]|nr:hypothetical protein DMUE_1047 [Dictyocoela muelleri]
MDINEAQIQIFMISQSRGFEELEVIHKIIYLVGQSDSAIQRWYYERGSVRDFPSDYEVFINELKEYIQGKDLSDLRKFRDEIWSEYIMRLKLQVGNSCTDMEIINKLRKMKKK